MLNAAACGDDSTGGGGSGASGGAGGVNAGGAGGAGGGSDVPLIGDVLPCGVEGTIGGMAKGTDLQRHDLDLDVFPDALCNDGTGAVIYYRPYEGAANKNRWVIQLLGGGSCETGQNCADRWCQVGTNFSKTQMSSDAAPTGGTTGNGIFARRADNPIGDFNQVLIRYCSSDMHAGLSRDVVVNANIPGTEEPVQFRMNFLGSRILDATLATLEADGVPTLAYTIGGGNVELPNLAEANLVIVAGASAGGGGTITHVDRIATHLREKNPNVAVSALIDSIFIPNREDLDWSTTELCSTEGICDYASMMQAYGDSRVYDVIDEDSCATWHAAHAPDTAWQCLDIGHVVRHHVTTPMFVRQGQTDSLLSSNFIDSGVSVPGYGPMDLPAFAALVRASLADLADLKTSAEEGADIAVTPGAYGPSCSKHETLRSTPDTFDVTIDQNGNSYSMFQVIANWASNMQPSSVITPMGGTDFCP
ncbi:MAG: pectin acetylesterase-family hydrolase [Polyangiaceae bacterium]